MSIVMSVDPKLINRWASGELESSSDGSAEFGRRKTKLFCGACCDVLRACIIVNIIFVSILSGFLLLCTVGYEPAVAILILPDEGEIIGDDDRIIDEEVNEVLGDFRITDIFTMPDVLFRLGGGIFFGIVGILGASRFNKYLVLCTAVWYIVHMTMAAMEQMWSVCMLAMIFCYAHVALFEALRKETITRENYKTEKECCYRCCGGEE